jgi:hypothetical protein
MKSGLVALRFAEIWIVTLTLSRNENKSGSRASFLNIGIGLYEASQQETTKTEINQALRQAPDLNSVWTEIVMEAQIRKMRASTEDQF